MKTPRRKQAKATSRSAVGVSQITVARHCDISQQRVAQLCREGVLVALPTGKLDIDDCRLRFIRWLRDEARKSTGAAASIRVRDARAQEIELRIAREKNQLVGLEDVEAFLTDTIGAFRSELSGVAAACTRDLAMRDVIEGHLNAAVVRCKKRFVHATRELNKTGKISEGEDE